MGSTIISVIILVVILGLSGYALVRNIKKQLKGQCTGCSRCSSAETCNMNNNEKDKE